jgi:Domain of unknown function (DUF4340)
MLSRTSRILLIVAAVAVGAYVLIELPRRRADDSGAHRLLASFEAASVDTVVLQRSDDTLRFTRYEDGWHMTSPLNDVAEPSTIESLLNAVANATPERNLGPAENPSTYGLDRPDVRILISSRPNTRFAIDVGKPTVDSAWRYARLARGDVLLIPTDVHRGATLPRDDYRNRRVVDFQLDEVERYSLVDDAHGTTWKRGPEGWFTSLAVDDTIAGDSVAVEAVLRRLRGLRVVSFLDETGSQKPEPYCASISLSRTNRTPLASISFCRMPDGSWHAHNSLRITAVVVEGDLSDLFQHTTTSLRDRRLIQFSPPDAHRIEIVSPSASGTLVRTGGVWSFPNPAMGRVDPERAADFVRALRSLKWSDLPPEGLMPPGKTARFSITVTSANGTILDEMRAEPGPNESLWWVTSISSGGPWLIDGARLDEMAARFANLRAK